MPVGDVLSPSPGWSVSGWSLLASQQFVGVAEGAGVPQGEKSFLGVIYRDKL